MTDMTKHLAGDRMDELSEAVAYAVDQAEGVPGEKELKHQLDRYDLFLTGWLKVDDGVPEAGQRILCFNGDDYWLSRWTPDLPHFGDPWNGGLTRKRATMWFALQDAPKA